MSKVMMLVLSVVGLCQWGKSVPMSFHQLQGRDQTIYMLGDYHSQQMEAVNELQSQNDILFKILDRFAKENASPSHIIWEASYNVLESREVYEQYQHLFIMQQAWEIPKIIAENQYTHMEFVASDNIRGSSDLLRGFSGDLAHLDDEHTRDERWQRIKETIQNPTTRSQILEHLELSFSILLRQMLQVRTEDLGFTKELLLGFEKGVGQVNEFFALFADYQQNEATIGTMLPQICDFLVLYVCNVEAMMNFLSAPHKKKFLFYFGIHHINLQSKVLSLVAMLQKLGYQQVASQQTKLLSADDLSL